VLLGFGVIVANGSYIYMKGLQRRLIHSATRMPVDEVTSARAVLQAPQIEGRTAALPRGTRAARTPRRGPRVGRRTSRSSEMLREGARVDRGRQITRSRPAQTETARVLGDLGGKKRTPRPDDDLAALERAFVTPRSSARRSTPRNPQARRAARARRRASTADPEPRATLLGAARRNRPSARAVVIASAPMRSSISRTGASDGKRLFVHRYLPDGARR
jgi:hypothetical protein